MHANRMSLFCDTALAARVEQAEAQLMAACAAGAQRDGDRTGAAPFTHWFAGGVATYAEDGSPYNKVAGLGFHGVPDTADLDHVETAFAARGVPTQIDSPISPIPRSPPCSPNEAIGSNRSRTCSARLSTMTTNQTPRPASRSVPATTTSSANGSTCCRMPWPNLTSTACPGTRSSRARPTSGRCATPRPPASAATPRLLAGGAGLRLADGITQFAGAATAPAHRRRGIQSALLSTRLADARAAGCDVAVITVQPGSMSQHNAHRHGFDLLHTRAIMVRRH